MKDKKTQKILTPISSRQSIENPFPDITNISDALDAINKHNDKQREKNKKNPRYRHLSSVFEAVCKEHLKSDTWTLSEAAHILSGYVPDRPNLADQGNMQIMQLEKHLRDSVNVSLFPAQTGFWKTDRFPYLQILQWAENKRVPFPKPLLNAVNSVKRPEKSVKPDNNINKPVKPRKDQVIIQQARRIAIEYWATHGQNKRISRKQVARHVCKELELSMDNIDKVAKWITEVDPQREEYQELYGKKSIT